MSTHECAGFWQCVYAYQTLITGLLAILAGSVAALVAYAQLRRMTTQSNVMVSAQLSQQIARIDRSRGWLLGRLKKFDGEVSRRLYEFETFENDVINAHWAADYASEGGRLMTVIDQHREETRLPLPLDAAVGDVLGRLKELADALDDIHRPASMEQHDEDHSFSDAEWQKIHDDAAVSEGRIGALAGKLRDSIVALEGSFAATLKQARERLSAIDNINIGAR